MQTGDIVKLAGRRGWWSFRYRHRTSGDDTFWGPVTKDGMPTARGQFITVSNGKDDDGSVAPS